MGGHVYLLATFDFGQPSWDGIGRQTGGMSSNGELLSFRVLPDQIEILLPNALDLEGLVQSGWEVYEVEPEALLLQVLVDEAGEMVGQLLGSFLTDQIKKIGNDFTYQPLPETFGVFQADNFLESEVVAVPTNVEADSHFAAEEVFICQVLAALSQDPANLPIVNDYIIWEFYGDWLPLGESNNQGEDDDSHSKSDLERRVLAIEAEAKSHEEITAGRRPDVVPPALAGKLPEGDAEDVIFLGDFMSEKLVNVGLGRQGLLGEHQNIHF
jgi:hypothetical protein